MKAELVFEFIKKQGFTIFLCCVGLWYFKTENKEMQTQINELNSYIRGEFKNSLQENTEVLKSVKESLINNKK